MIADCHGNLDYNIARLTRGLARALCGAFLGLAACTQIVHGGFATKGYTSGYGYDVSYRAGTQSVLPGAWHIDNYRLATGKWVRKDVAPYLTTYSFDHDGDGRADETHRLYTYALRYEHSVHSGVIWLRNIPISGKLRNKDLRVLMQEYIDQITAATYETVRLDAMSPTMVVEHRQAAVIVEQGPATVAGKPAYVATIDIADVDQIKLAPGARTRRVQLVLMRAPQDEKIEQEADRKPTNYPVIVLAGYSNMPTDFPAAYDEFHDFLGRLTIDGRSGLALNTAPSELPVAPSGSPSGQTSGQTSAPQAHAASL